LPKSTDSPRESNGDATLCLGVTAGAASTLKRFPELKERDMTELKEQRDRLDDDQFAFPKERKEPLKDATHVRNAIARFNQVEGVSDSERDAAWGRIKRAAKKFGVEVNENSWREIGKK
jgi:hypothetical protein